MIYVQEYIDGQPNRRPIEQPTKKKKALESQLHLIYTIMNGNSRLVTQRLTSPLPARASTFFRCQTNGFAMLYHMPELDKQGLGEHCTTVVMRYLLMSRVERATNNDLKLSLLGSDRPSGLYILAKAPE